MWNRRSLDRPPECKIKVKLCDSDIDTLTAAKLKLDESKNGVEGCLKLLTDEHYVMKRIIYKCLNQMRRDKALASFRQVNNCMNRLKQMKIESRRETLLEYVSVPVSVIRPEVYLLSRQLLQYYLVRLMSVAALLTQTARYCSHTYLESTVKQYLGLGNLVQHYLVIMAGSARVWYACRSLRMHVCSWYQALYCCLDVVTPTQVQWLPDTESLPDNISIWILGQFGEETMPELTSEGSTSGTEVPGQELDTGGDLYDGEDLGVPVQRSVIPEDITVSVEDKPPKKKKKKKKLKAGKATSETDSPTIVTNAEDLQAERTLKLKKHLKPRLKSKDDFSDFVKRLNGKKVTVGDEVIVLTKVGKRKIIKKIDAFSLAAPDNDPEAVVEKVLLTKLRNCIGRLLVKYDKSSKGNRLKPKNTEKKTRAQSVNASTEDDDKHSDNTSEAVVETYESVAKQKLKQKKKKEKKKLGVQLLKTEKPVQNKKPFRNCSSTVTGKRKGERKIKK